MQQFGRNKWKFTAAMVEDAPTTRGVFALWENDELICIGRADGGERTIRSCLFEHLEGANGDQSRAATHYSWEICLDPEVREAELLRQLQNERPTATAGRSNVTSIRRSA